MMSAESVSMLIAIGLAAIPILLGIGFALGKYNAGRTRRTLRPLRMSTSFILVVCAALLWASSTALSSAARSIFFGMAFGFCGDLILADVIRLRNPMIFGIIAFGIGHIFYITGFIQASQALGLSNPLSGSMLWVVYVMVVGVLWVAVINNPHKSRTLNIGSLIYAWLIAIMAGTAGGLAIQDGRFGLTALGGLLFLISDLILGNRELRDNAWFLVHDVVWVIYIAGQALIVLTTR